MKSQILATIAFLTTLSLTTSVQAANSEHIRKLLATKQCQNCDLSFAGLVMADLAGADLSGANLTGANLSRANLSGANLTSANLSGAGLFGVNLIAAKLNAANLTSADLRNTYLMHAEFTGADLTGTNFQGATGIPLQIVTPEKLYALGMTEAQKGNFKPAMDYFTQAIAMKPDYAGAYLARGVASYQDLDRQSALKDAQIAERLFTSQNNQSGIEISQAFIQELQTPLIRKVKPGKPSFFNLIQSLSSLFLQILPF